MGHYRTGIVIALIMAVLTAFEFWVAHVNSGVTFLMLIAAAKAILVVGQKAVPGGKNQQQYQRIRR